MVTEFALFWGWFTLISLLKKNSMFTQIRVFPKQKFLLEIKTYLTLSLVV